VPCRCIFFSIYNNEFKSKILKILLFVVFVTDENTGFNWATRYKIIRGACEGLKYLHEGLESPLLHLDLKPENILLDKNMTPKIADFGVSRFFDEENTTESSSRGTR
jgi:serine/threonine protein kinase